MKTAAIGFRSKTGRAIAVALDVSKHSPEFILRREITLWDAKTPETFQPHHEVMELTWPEALRAVRPIERAIERVAAGELKKLANELGQMGFKLALVGVVGSPDRPLEKLGNFHIRAHAAEGILFRRVIEVAAEKQKLKWASFSSRDILQTAGEKLKLPSEEIDTVMKTLGRIAGSPWRADERAAAVAAWTVSRK